MIPFQQLIASYGDAAPAFTYATWNPADKQASMVLSNGNLTFLCNVVAGSARSTVSKASGKWYWECLIVNDNSVFIGIAKSTMSTSGYLGQDANGYGYYINGTKTNGSGFVAYGSAYTNGDRIGVALDMDAGTITFYKNNVSQGVAFSGITGSIFAAGSSGGGSGGSATANFGATALTYSPPAGFNAGLYN